MRNAHKNESKPEKDEEIKFCICLCELRYQPMPTNYRCKGIKSSTYSKHQVAPVDHWNKKIQNRKDLSFIFCSVQLYDLRYCELRYCELRYSEKM